MAAEKQDLTNIQGIMPKMSALTSLKTPSKAVCRICGKELDYFETNLFGEIKRFPISCNCEIESYEENLKSKETERIIRKKNEVFSVTKLGSKFQKRNVWIPKEGAENVAIWTKRFIQNIKNNNKVDSLILWGISGNGKTQLAAYAYNELTDAGFNCIFTKVIDLLNLIGSTQKRDTKLTESKIYDIFRDADAVFLDDLGTEVYTDNKAVWLYNIIEILYNYEIPSIITMNDYAPEKMAVNEHMGKVFDRFKEMYIKVRNKAESHRDWLEAQRIKEIKEKELT